MKIPLVDLGQQYGELKSEIDASLRSICEKTQFILGPSVADFEAAFAEYCGTKGCVAVNSGTSALHLALLAAGIGPGDEVICPSWTFIATIEAVMYTGATPILIDSDEETYNTGPDAVRAAITEKTKAIILVHLYGHPVRMSEVMEMAQERGIAVIEDAAQAHGAMLDGKRVGSIGDIGCFSFYPSKNLGAFGEGGAVTSNNEEWLAHIRSLRSHGETERYVHGEIGFNMRMSGFQGAVLGIKLKHLDVWNEKRRTAASMYRNALKGTPLILPADDRSNTKQVYHMFVVRAPKRDELRASLTEKGIGTGIHYLRPTHKQPLWISRFGDHRPLPVSERLADEVISLPIFPELSEEQVSYIAGSIKEFYA